jgi:hypothetical protein
VSIMPPKNLLDGYAVGQVRRGRVIWTNEVWLDVVLEQGPGWGIYGMLIFSESQHPEVARQYRPDQPIVVEITHLLPGDRHSLRLRLADELASAAMEAGAGPRQAEPVAAPDPAT